MTVGDYSNIRYLTDVQLREEFAYLEPRYNQPLGLSSLERQRYRHIKAEQERRDSQYSNRIPQLSSSSSSSSSSFSASSSPPSSPDFKSELIELMDIKNDAITQGANLPWKFYRKVLIFIRNILLYNLKHWETEICKKRRRSLYMIVRASLLLKQDFKDLYSHNRRIEGERVTCINLWRNIDFLIQSQLTTPNYDENAITHISDEQVDTILNELLSLANSLLQLEISTGSHLRLRLEKTDGFNAVNEDYQQYITETLTQHQAAHPLPHLEAITSYKREQLMLDKILLVIDKALHLDLHNQASKNALMWYLQIIGESLTEKNFSIPTNRLVCQVDSELFVRLRNKLSHNEWDISRNDFRLIDINLMQGILGDLKQLREIIKDFRLEHQRIGSTSSSLLDHYRSKIASWKLRAVLVTDYTNFVQNCHEKNALTEDQRNELLALLNTNITCETNLINIQETLNNYIQPIIGKRNELKDLRRTFSQLNKSFKNEKTYLKNYLKGKQPTKFSHIQRLEQLLDYNKDTYIQYMQKPPSLLRCLSIIALIKREKQLLIELVSSLDGHEVLRELPFPENTTGVNLTTASLNKFFNKIQLLYPIEISSVHQAYNMIKKYCNLIKEPFHIEKDGLYHVKINQKSYKNIEYTPEITLEYIQFFKIFARKCQFYISLYQNSHIVDACFYCMGKIQKYLTVLCRLFDNISELPQNMNYALMPRSAEITALRNFVHHGNDLFDSLNISGFRIMAQYAAIFMNELAPAIKRIEDNLMTQQGNRATHTRRHSF